MNANLSVARFVATGAGVGNIGFAPGTWGTVLALPICWALSFIHVGYAAACTAVLIAAAVWAAHVMEKKLGRKDPGCIVIDEVAGMVVTLLGLSFTVKSAVLGFVVFRFLDIVKPPPVGTLDRRLTGGIGIVADDVAAGVVGNLALRLVFLMTGA